MVYMRDVAHVRDGNPPQSNIVHVDGNRSVLMQVLKKRRGLDAGNRRRYQKQVDAFKATLPQQLNIAVDRRSIGLR